MTSTAASENIEPQRSRPLSSDYHTVPPEGHNASLLTLSVLALAVGVITGIGAVALRMLIGLVHNVFYAGHFSHVYDANITDLPSYWGNWVFFSPVIGGLIVVYLVQRFAPEAKGHGVPEVMDSVFYKDGNIRWQVAVIKSLASALSIGSGAAVGREGPIIQIGAALGSTFSQMIKITKAQKITLLGAGAGAGIAATFNTPLGGVLFAVEILLPEISNRTFIPVVIATGTATAIGRMLIGPDPAFAVPEIHFAAANALTFEQIITFVILGLLCGLAAWMFITLLSYLEDLFPALIPNPYLQNIVGMSFIGLGMVVLMNTFGHPYISGVGYGVIQSILDNSMSTMWVLMLLFVLKLLATSISLGCGASGGIFSPSLYMGATLGATVVGLMGHLFSDPGLSMAGGAMIGMAAMVGAATGGVMTAIVMIFEMTRDYQVMLPLIVAVAVAAGIRRSLVNDTIYSIKLRHRGHNIPQDRHTNRFLVTRASEVMERQFILADGNNTLRETIQGRTTDDLPAIVVHREGRIAGLIPPRSGLWRALSHDPDVSVSQFMETHLVLARDNDLMSEVFRRLRRHHGGAAIVFKSSARKPHAEDVIGIITKRAIADTVIHEYND
ncbi:MAG: chloride channel protein [Hyphomicrobiaceae bacterium]